MDVLRLARQRARAERLLEVGPEAVADVLRAADEALASPAPAAPLLAGERAAALPAGAALDPAFLTPAQQSAVLRAVDAAAAGRWIAGGAGDSPRLVANFGGQPGRALVTEPLPPFLATLASRLAARFGWPAPPAHCLVNDYRGGAGLDHHSDGPLYARSAVITLAGPALMELRPRAGGGPPAPAPAVHLHLRPGCALALEGPAYRDWTHGIAAAGADAIPPACVNAPPWQVGQVVHRAPRRVSLVFVCKVA